MKNIHAMAGGSVGYVRGLASVRCGGVAFPLDLVRAVAKTAARLAVRRRVGAAFSGYLVTEPAGFSGRRAWHLGLLSHTWRSGDFSRPFDFQPWAVDCGAAIDAPPCIAAGGSDLLHETTLGVRYSCSMFAVRGAA